MTDGFDPFCPLQTPHAPLQPQDSLSFGLYKMNLVSLQISKYVTFIKYNFYLDKKNMERIYALAFIEIAFIKL